MTALKVNGIYMENEIKKIHIGGVDYYLSDVTNREDLSSLQLMLNNIIPTPIEYKKAQLRYASYLKSVSASSAYGEDLRKHLIGMEEFGRLGLGLFIHWGVYSVPAGNYKGTKQTGSKITSTKTTYNTEWIMRDLSIPKDIYKEYETQFTGINFDADDIAKTASEAGMKYIVITAKHHEGFSLYPTAYGNWDVRTSGCRTTILDELKEACDKYGLKFGLYYSQYWDWMSEGGFGLNHKSSWNGSSEDLYTDEEHTAYCISAAKQINEMVEKYNPFILWYDPGTSYDDKYQKIFRDSFEQNHPHVIINDRVQHNRGYAGDFGTGERTICFRGREYSEACFTMNNTWGYSDNNENSYYGTEKCFKDFMIYSLAYGQNCLMNIGPKGDGSIPSKQISLINDIKNFTDSYGKFYGYKRAKFNCMPRWGYMLQLQDNKVACYIIQKGNPSFDTIKLDGVPTKNLKSVEILTSKIDSPSYTILSENVISVTGLGYDSSTNIGVVVCSYETIPVIPDVNYVDSTETITSPAFPAKSNMNYNFTNFCYDLVPSQHIVCTTEFVWLGGTGNYNIVSDKTTTDDTVQEVISVYNVTDSSALSDLSTDSSFLFRLEHGKHYKLSFNITGTNTGKVYNFKGVNFTVGGEIETISVTGVSFDKNNVSLYRGEQTELNVTVQPYTATNKTYTLTSDNPEITIVDGNKISVSENALGTYTITVTTEDGGFTDTCTVNVMAHVASVSFDTKTATIYSGEYVDLSVTVLPADANNKKYTITSNSSDITINGNRATASATAVGTYILTATTEDGSKVDTFTLIVKEPIIDVTGISFKDGTLTVDAGGSTDVVVNISPANATNKNYTLSSNSPDITFVGNKLNASSTANGNYTITVTSEDGGFTANCDVSVITRVTSVIFDTKTGTIKAGESLDLSVTVLPENATNKNYTITSYSSNITVNGNRITASYSARDEYVVIVTTEDGAKTDTFTLTVQEPDIPIVNVTGISFAEKNISIDAGESYDLTINITPDDATDKTYTLSADSLDITFIGHKLTASNNAVGTHVITVTSVDGNFTDTCNLTVIKHVESVSFDSKSATIMNGESTDLSVTVLPENASNKNYIITSNSDDITVTGNHITASNSASGTYTLTVTTEDGYLTDTFTLTVDVSVTGISFEQEALTIDAGESTDVIVTVYPDNAKNKNYTLSSNSTDITFVGNRMTVSEFAKGNYTITATSEDGNHTDTCAITVIEQVFNVTGVAFAQDSISAKANSTVVMGVNIEPSYATNKNYTLSCDSADISINGNELTLSETALGDYTITVTTEDGNKTDTCVLTAIPIIRVTGVNINKTNETIFAGRSLNLTVSVLPDDADNKNYTITTSDDDVFTIDGDKVTASYDALGNYTITVTTEDGNFTATCELTVEEMIYDYLFEVNYLDGSADQGEDTGLKLFSDSMLNWTLFATVPNSLNPNADKNATLYQCVTDASPWCGVRIDADNATALNTGTTPAPLRFGFNKGSTRYYLNSDTGEMMNQSVHQSAAGHHHPVAFSRNGDVYKVSIDGVNWTTLKNDTTTSAQLAMLIEEPLTVAFDYRRSGGKRLESKYRFLKTDEPVCVALKYESEFDFGALYHKYDQHDDE